MPAADPSEFPAAFEQVLADKERDSRAEPSQRGAARATRLVSQLHRRTGSGSLAIAESARCRQIECQPCRACGPENPASIFAALGRHEEEFQRLRLASEGLDPAVAARSLARLAALDPGNAETWYRQAVQSEEAASGKEDSRVALLLNNLALALRQKNDNASAEPLLRRALAIQQKRSSQPSAVAATLNNLGSLLQSTRKSRRSVRANGTTHL
jgi:tetratricopeptide (TPR) repeat protein